jgi:acyl-CoA synthetase (NDP forming)
LRLSTAAPAPVPRPSLAEALFEPRAVALIGVSDDAGKTAGRPLRFLRKHGYAGPVYPINPNRSAVQGERAYASLREAPGPVDHAYILVNTPAVEAAVSACAEAGVTVATILASGFAEAGEAGRERQRRILEIARARGLRLVGPNSLGVVSTRAALALTANAAFAAESLPRGRLTVLSQSGSLIGTLLSRGAVRGIGFGKLISVGNEADLSVGEIGAALADDPDSDAFLLFLETIRAREEMIRFAALARRAGKPVIAYKLGRSEIGQALAVSHTGAMVGSDAAVDAFLRHHGIMRVDHLETLLEMAPLVIGRRPPAGSRRVGAIATTGGGAAMVVDRLGVLGVSVAPASGETLAKLRAVNVPAEAGPIVDLTLAGTRYEVMRPALDILMAAPEFALVLATVGSSAQFQPELAVKPIVDCAREKKPLAVFLTPQADETLRLLAEHGIAAFRTPEACADAIAAYLAWQDPPAAHGAKAETLAQAGAFLQAAQSEVLDERQSLAIFQALGVPVVSSLVIDPSAPLPALPFAFPVAAKVLSPDITHKTDAGAVALEIATASELGERPGGGGAAPAPCGAHRGRAGAADGARHRRGAGGLPPRRAGGTGGHRGHGRRLRRDLPGFCRARGAGIRHRSRRHDRGGPRPRRAQGLSRPAARRSRRARRGDRRIVDAGEPVGARRARGGNQSAHREARRRRGRRRRRAVGPNDPISAATGGEGIMLGRASGRAGPGTRGSPGRRARPPCSARRAAGLWC